MDCGKWQEARNNHVAVLWTRQIKTMFPHWSVLFAYAFRIGSGVIKTLILLVLGSKNLRTSSFKDHTVSDMHQHTMKLLKKSQSSGNIASYAPIAKALTTLDARTEEIVKKKFEIAYFLIKENSKCHHYGCIYSS